MKTFLIAAAAVCVGSALVSSGAYGRTWRVNTTGTGDAPTIAAALDGCAAGDSVLVAAGSYELDSHLFFPKEDITLVSEAGAAATVLERAGTAPVLVLVETGSVVEGFTFESVFLGGGTSFTHGGRISNNIFHGSGDPNSFAMSFWEHYGTTISGNIICSYGEGIGLSESSSFIFEHNTIMGCGIAIRLDGSYPWNTVRHNLIVGNDYGIDLSGGVAGDVSCNDVFGNSIANYMQGTDPTGTNGNISVDPQFCAVDPAASGNFVLQSDSPCAPGNHPDGASCGIIGACPVGCGEISVKRASWGAIKAIYR
jgi:hypothetical protein